MENSRREAETAQLQVFQGRLAADGEAANWGLRFDRFLPVWEGVSGAPSGKRLKDYKEVLRQFVNAFNRAGAQSQALLEGRHRLLDLAGGQHRDFKTDWRYVSGLGVSHPIENGFTFDRALGVPVILGSSVKGLVRAAAHVSDATDGEIDRLLGPKDPRPGEAAAGGLVFLDAYPSRWPRLAIDIVNCHHPAYYDDLEARRDRADPVDWENPNPVYFLSVDRGAVFRFRIVPRAGAAADLAIAWDWLKTGLDWLGIGAKTAAGYGQMRELAR